jgi:ATP-binding cassette subfamily C protein
MSRALTRRWMRTPVVLQMEAAECGAAALGMVLGYHGCPVPLEELRDACAVSRDGSKASHILQAARKYGLKARAVRTGIEGLWALPGPVVVFWQFHHFVVLEGWSRQGRRYFLNDPACGRRSVGAAEFDAGFTGIALVMEPGPDFVRRARPDARWAFLQQTIRQSPGTWLFVNLCALLFVPPTLAIPAFLRVFIDDYYIGGEAAWIVGLVAGLALCAGLIMALTGLQRGALLRWHLRAGPGQSDEFFSRLLVVPLWWMNGRSPDELARRAALPEDNARLFALQIAPPVLALPVLVGFVIYLFACQPFLALPVLLLSAAGLALAWKRREQEAARNQAHAESLLAGAASQGLLHAETLKCGGGAGFLRKLAGLRLNLLQQWQLVGAARHTQTFLQENLAGLGTVLLLAGGGAFLLSGHLTAGTLVAMIFAWRQVHRILEDWRTVPDALQRLRENCEKISDVPVAPALPPAQPSPLAKLEAKEVVFGYNRFAPPLLSGVSLAIERGQHLAVVGAGGSGKSTLLKLLAGLEQPWSGSVERNGTSKNNTSGSIVLLHEVPQFFAGTIEDNFLGGSVAEFSQALQVAGLHDLHPDSTLPAPSGTGFSQGEHQRLELACALTRRPDLLLLDEAFSALESESVVQILHALRPLGHTVLQVTHDPHVLIHADKILVLEGGRIAEQGSFRQLSQIGTLFSTLVGA